MKRDADLIRKIALETEKLSAGRDLDRLDGVEPEAFFLHAKLMAEANLIEAVITPLIHGGGVAVVTALTWQGHDFAKAARDDTIWNKAKKSVIAPSAAWTLNLLTSWLSEEIKQRFPSIST